MARTCKVPMHNGQVACPYAPPGVTVDVELCYRCRRLKGFYDEESGTKAVCVAPRRARNLVAWLAPGS
jgi:hypothetical protein